MTASPPTISLLCLALALAGCGSSSDEPAAAAEPLADDEGVTSTGEAPPAAGQPPTTDPAGAPESGTGGEATSEPAGQPTGQSTGEATGEATGQAGGDVDTDTGATPVPPSESEQQDDVNPFQTPDPEGATVLQRRGYRDAANQADALLSTRYLDVYRDASDGLQLLAEDLPLGIEPEGVVCPQGGMASLSRPESTMDEQAQSELLRFLFEECGVEGMILSGQLEQRLSRSGTRFDEVRKLDSRFANLVLELDNGTRLQLDGSSNDDQTETSVPECGPIPIGTTKQEVSLASVTITSPQDGTTRLRDARYVAQDENYFDDRGTCDRERRISFNGSATAVLVSEPDGPVTVSLSKTGTLLRDDDQNPPTGGQAAMQAISSDDSALVVTTTDDAQGLARFDLRAGSAVVSFEDSYSFEP